MVLLKFLVAATRRMCVFSKAEGFAATEIFKTLLTQAKGLGATKNFFAETFNE